MNALTLRFALPAIVIVAIVTVVAVAVLFATHTCTSLALQADGLA